MVKADWTGLAAWKWYFVAIILLMTLAVVACPAREVKKEVRVVPPSAEPAAPQTAPPATAPGEPSDVGYNGSMEGLTITSSAFANGAKIPPKYTADGGDVNPPLMISGVPVGTRSLALIMDDPDAPVGTWDHWIVFNIPPDVTEIAENSIPENALIGRNSWGRNDYGGPSPPSGTHRYFFKLYALDTELDLPFGTKKAKLEAAMKGHILADAEFVGLYSR